MAYSTEIPFPVIRLKSEAIPIQKLFRPVVAAATREFIPIANKIDTNDVPTKKKFKN